MKFGEKLKELRTEKSMTQEDVAKAIGVSRRTYLGYEQESHYPRKKEIYGKLAEVFHCNPKYLMGEEEAFITEAAENFGSRGLRQAIGLVSDLSGMFAGGDLSEEDKDAVFTALQKAYYLAKEDNKKYTRLDYQDKPTIDSGKPQKE